MKKDRYTKAFILLEEINKIVGLRYVDLVPWGYVYDNWKIGQVQNINGSSNTCLIRTEGHMRFSTIIPPGCSFLPHKHDFIEHVKVQSGQFYEGSREKTYEPGDLIKYREFESHVPKNISNEPCIIQVDFYR